MLNTEHNMHINWRHSRHCPTPGAQDPRALLRNCDYAPGVGGVMQKVHYLIFDNADSRTAEQQSELRESGSAC